MSNRKALVLITTSIDQVQCITGEGIYNAPEAWPNCTETVSCGTPVEPTVNGSRTWIKGEQDQVFRVLQVWSKKIQVRLKFLSSSSILGSIYLSLYLLYEDDNSLFQIAIKIFDKTFSMTLCISGHLITSLIFYIFQLL